MGTGEQRKETLVLGLGNPLMGDDGVGIECLNLLGNSYLLPEGVDLVDGGTMGMFLLDRVAGYERLLLADSVALKRLPGTVIRLADGEIDRVFSTCLSPHQAGVNDLLGALVLMEACPSTVVVIGMVPQSISTRVGLSPPVAAALPQMVAGLVDELHTWGYSLEPRPDRAVPLIRGQPDAR